MNKEELFETLKKYNLDNTKYIVIGGAAMLAQNLRDKTNDIDIAVSSDYYDYLLKNYECKVEIDDIYYIDNIINFGKGYYDIFNTVTINGIRFQNLKSLRELKKKFNRPKDIDDINKIDQYLKGNPLVLAYIGDAVYEEYIRKYLVSKNIVKVKDLQHESIKYVSAPYQAKFLRSLIDNNMLTEEEVDVVKRARNHKSRSSKNTDIITYKYSTAFEALIGYLELLGDRRRIEEIMDYIYSYKEV